MDSTIITPIRDRTDMALVAEMYFKQTGNAVEVGVWEGEFAAHNLKSWKGHYYMVDKWAHRQGGDNDKNMPDAGSWEQVLDKAKQNVFPFDGRARIFKEESVAAVVHFNDNRFDWIYIDAQHDYESLKADLNAWWPKIREGGLFSGDDYGDAGDKRWSETYGDVANQYNWGVQKAVEEFAAQVGRQVHVTWMNDKSATPSWYIIK